MSDREKRLSAERAAMDACRSGLSVRKAAALYGLKQTTLHHRITGRHKLGCKKGRKFALHEDLEAAIVDWLRCSKNVPETYSGLLAAIQEYLVRTNTPNPFKENRLARLRWAYLWWAVR